MRHSLRALLTALVVIGCCQFAVAQESRSSWWPFAAKNEPVSPAPPATVAPTTPSTASPTPPPSAAATAQIAAPSAPRAPLAQYQASTTVQTDRSPIIESPLPSFTWPKVEWPQLTMPKPQMPQLWPNREQAEATRNAWAGKSPDPQPATPLQAMRDGAHRVGESTRTAWHKTVDTLFPSARMEHNTGAHIAQREIKPPFWKRMFGSQEPEPEGPQTIPQWMAQDRLDP